MWRLAALLNFSSVSYAAEFDALLSVGGDEAERVAEEGQEQEDKESVQEGQKEKAKDEANAGGGDPRGPEDGSPRVCKNVEILRWRQNQHVDDTDSEVYICSILWLVHAHTCSHAFGISGRGPRGGREGRRGMDTRAG